MYTKSLSRPPRCRSLPFFFNPTAPTEIYTLSLHDALPICPRDGEATLDEHFTLERGGEGGGVKCSDRKSTRLNSSHSQISYAVFCLKKKKTTPGSHPDAWLARGPGGSPECHV